MTPARIPPPRLSSLWLKALTLVALLIATRLWVPSDPIDPWGLFNFQKIFQLVLAITLIQSLGILLMRQFGVRAGVIVTGLIGGLISSTAMTASLARRSRHQRRDAIQRESLLYTCATFSMLVEAVLMVILSNTAISPFILIVFFGPLAITLLRIYRQSRRQGDLILKAPKDNTDGSALSSIKLSAFILAILAASKLGQRLFGQLGLITLTFLVSLFEIHGSVIANTQLQQTGDVSFGLLGGLLTVSICSSYVSKLFLVSTLGSRALTQEVGKWTLQILLSLAASWFAFSLVAKG